jgi:hypothetical protein
MIQLDDPTTLTHATVIWLGFGDYLDEETTAKIVQLVLCVARVFISRSECCIFPYYNICMLGMLLRFVIIPRRTQFYLFCNLYRYRIPTANPDDVGGKSSTLLDEILGADCVGLLPVGDALYTIVASIARIASA